MTSACYRKFPAGVPSLREFGIGAAPTALVFTFRAPRMVSVAAFAR